MRFSDHALVERFKQIKTDEERAKVGIEWFLDQEPTIEEIEERKKIWSENDDIDNCDVDNWTRMWYKNNLIPFRELLLKELDRHISLGYNPYQE